MDGRFIRRSEENCSYFRSIFYRLAVADFYTTLDRMTEDLRFFRDEHGVRVNE